MGWKMITNKKKTSEYLEQYFKDLPEKLNFQLFCESDFSGLPQETILWVENITITEIAQPDPIKQSVLQRLLSILKKWFRMILGFEK